MDADGLVKAIRSFIEYLKKYAVKFENLASDMEAGNQCTATERSWNTKALQTAREMEEEIRTHKTKIILEMEKIVKKYENKEDQSGSSSNMSAEVMLSYVVDQILRATAEQEQISVLKTHLKPGIDAVMGQQAAAEHVGGGAAGSVFSVHGLITEFIQKYKQLHHKADKQSLRHLAADIQTVSTELNDALTGIKEEFKMARRQNQAEIDEIIQGPLKRMAVLDNDVENKRKQTSVIKVALLNVCSMKGKIGKTRIEKTNTILYLIRQNCLDVFCTTETKLKDDEAEKILRGASADNFRFCYQTRAAKEDRGGGVAIQFLETLQLEQSVFQPEYKIPNCEVIGTVVKHDEWDKPLLIICLYRQPQPNQVDDFIVGFQSIWDQIKQHECIVLTGDFNIHVDDDKDMKAQDFKKLLKKNELVLQPSQEQPEYEPTHERGHTLDLVITRNVEISGFSVRNDRISDHYTVYFSAKPVSQGKGVKSGQDVEQFKQQGE